MSSKSAAPSAPRTQGRRSRIARTARGTRRARRRRVARPGIGARWSRPAGGAAAPLEPMRDASTPRAAAASADRPGRRRGPKTRARVATREARRAIFDAPRARLAARRRASRERRRASRSWAVALSGQRAAVADVGDRSATARSAPADRRAPRGRRGRARGAPPVLQQRLDRRPRAVRARAVSAPLAADRSGSATAMLLTGCSVYDQVSVSGLAALVEEGAQLDRLACPSGAPESQAAKRR